MFQDISNFDKTSDYLSIVNAVIITDLFVIVLLITGYIQSKVLFQWYKKYNLSAVMADVLIIVIGIIITRYVYPYIFEGKFSIVKFIILAVAIQIIHDISFFFIFQRIPRGVNQMMDTFKDYAREVGYKAVLSDSGMMILACLLSSYFVSLNTNINLIILIISLYILPYLIYS